MYQVARKCHSSPRNASDGAPPSSADLGAGSAFAASFACPALGASFTWMRKAVGEHGSSTFHMPPRRPSCHSTLRQMPGKGQPKGDMLESLRLRLSYVVSKLQNSSARRSAQTCFRDRRLRDRDRSICGPSRRRRGSRGLRHPLP